MLDSGPSAVGTPRYARALPEVLEAAEYRRDHGRTSRVEDLARRACGLQLILAAFLAAPTTKLNRAMSSLIQQLPLAGGGGRAAWPARVIGYLRFFFAVEMLTDKEAEEIERRRKEGVSGGPIVLAWVDRLLADRKERVRHVQYLRQRLNQAFRYLDGLLRDVQTSRPRPAPVSRAKPLYCPSCGQPYARAYGISPDGIAYVHADGRECRMGTSVKDENSSLP